jgi:multidrug efflux pump subunit AcrA (membrane-fusion protein)
VLASITAFFALFPYPFTLSANGQLQPLVQREIYAQVSGILQELFVAENDSVRVSKDEVLARLSNNDLDVQIQNLEGQISQTNEQIRKYSRAQSDRHGLDRLDSVMLDGESLKATQQLESLKRELQIKKQQAENLIVRSPADGIVVNWQVRQALLKRPVERGQNLMTVIDPTGGWQLEIEIPERRLGHLLQRVHSKEEPVQVSFALVSHPGQEYSGTLVQVDEKLDVYSDDGNCAKAIVRFENGQVPAELLKAGTRINAKLNCGTRSIGFVWFHEFFETIETACRYWL